MPTTDKQEAMISAIRRKNCKDVLATFLHINGAPEEVIKDVVDASRLTNALIDRSIQSLPSETDIEVPDAPEPDDVYETEDGSSEEIIGDDLVEAFANGKIKKAKKLLKQYKADGIKKINGRSIKKWKKLIKAEGVEK